MKKRILATILAGSMAVSLLSGCSSLPNDVKENPEGETTQTTEDKPKVEVDTSDIEGLTYKLEKDPSEYKLYCYWPAPDTYFDNYVLEGLKAFEKEYGVTIDYGIGTEWTQDVENQMVEAKLSEGYELFYVFGADTTGANALYSEIYDAGGKVVNYAGMVDDPQESASTFASNVYDQAYQSTKKLIEYMGEEGEIINVLEQLTDVNTQKRQQGVEDAVAEYPNVKICQTVADISTPDQGYEKISDAISANSNADAIIATGGTAGSIGLANALNDYYGSNPEAKHLYAASVDQSDEVMNAIEKGYIDHTVAQNGWAQGYVSPLVLCMMEDGYEPKEFGQFVDTGYIFITKENADTWQEDIVAKAKELIGTLESDWFVK